MTREEAYKENPKVAAMTDFLVMYEKKLKGLYLDFCTDEKEIPTEENFIAFVVTIYNEAQHLVIEPELN